MHPLDLVLVPAEESGPGRIDAGEITFEIGDAQQVFRHLPDAIALADALRDFGFEPVIEEVQGLLFADALGRFDAGRKNAADPVQRRVVRDRAVADRKSSVLDNRALAADGPRVIFGEKGFTLAAQDRFVQRPELRVDFPPGLAQRAAQCLRVLVAQDGSIGIVVNEDQLGPPSDRHRKPRSEDHRDAELQALRPSLAAAERGRRPVHLADPSCHFSGQVGKGADGHRTESKFPPEHRKTLGHTGMPRMSSPTYCGRSRLARARFFYRSLRQ